MERRLKLQGLLETLLGSRNVYFQPPPNVELKYPCIKYSKDSIKTDFANDRPYQLYTKYKITIIDEDPDSKIVKRIAELPMCTFSTQYTVNNLNHNVFNLSY